MFSSGRGRGGIHVMGYGRVIDPILPPLTHTHTHAHNISVAKSVMTVLCVSGQVGPTGPIFLCCTLMLGPHRDRSGPFGPERVHLSPTPTYVGSVSGSMDPMGPMDPMRPLGPMGLMGMMGPMDPMHPRCPMRERDDEGASERDRER